MAPTIATETGVALPSADLGTEKGKSQAAAGLRSIVLPLGLAFVVLAAWQLYVTVWNIPAVILPSPLRFKAWKLRTMASCIWSTNSAWYSLSDSVPSPSVSYFFS